jgi:hypothetical protein
MAYKNPDQIERVIHSLSYPGVHFYIHLDKKIDIGPFSRLKDLENVNFIQNRVLVNWGTFSLTRAILASLGEVMQRGTYSFFGFISAQDYPLKPVKELYTLLDENPGINLLTYLPRDHSWYQEAKLRTEYYYCNELPIPGKYKIEYLLNLFFRRFRYKFSSPLYGAPGSTFMILSEECCRFLMESIQKNAWLRFHLELTWGPDEFIFQTLIMHSHYRDKVRPNILYYMNWKEEGLHPKTFTQRDQPELENRSEFFARKFDMEKDSGILDLLDSKLKAQSSII